MVRAVRADERFGTIPGMALEGADRFGDAAAFVDQGLRLSFADVAEGLVRVGRALMAAGVEPGDRVALWAPNSAIWPVAALGVHACGAWLVPLNTRFKGDEAAYIIDRADARVLLVVDSFLETDYVDMVRKAAPSVMADRQCVTLPGPGSVHCPQWDDFLASGDKVEAGRLHSRLGALGPEDVSDVIFTSGTTGMPKGVMLRHGASLRAYEAYNRGFRLSEGDRHLIAVPFFHCFGYKAGWMLDLMMGATTYPVPVFEPESVMALIAKERITHMGGPPTIFQSILDHPQRGLHDLSSLRSVLVGAAAVPASLIVRLREDAGIAGAMSGYGLTENHALVSVADPEDPPEVIATTVGRTFPGIEVCVVDDSGNPVGPSEPGELLVRGFGLMSGYFRDPDATAATVVDGWLHTGDVATIDVSGYIRITDRKKDIYVMGGFNVSPVEVENALSGLADVAEVAVVGMPDESFGEVGAAFVVPKPGTALTPEEVRAYAREHLANFKVPRRIEIVESLPRNATGKVVKPELRRQLAETSHRAP
jgi:acyl-CoA synthetase (AMP-forming)/AMP-acid ligase II